MPQPGSVSGRFRFGGVSMLRSGRWWQAQRGEFPITRRSPFTGLVYQRGFDDSFLLVTDAVTNVATGVEAFTDVAQDALTTTGVGIESVAEASADAFNTVGASIQSLIEVGIEGLT